MTKADFTKAYAKLTKAEKDDLKAYYDDIYRNAHFIGTFDEAERRLNWIKEIEGRIK